MDRQGKGRQWGREREELEGKDKGGKREELAGRERTDTGGSVHRGWKELLWE